MELLRGGGLKQSPVRGRRACTYAGTGSFTRSGRCLPQDNYSRSEIFQGLSRSLLVTEPLQRERRNDPNHPPAGTFRRVG